MQRKPRFYFPVVPTHIIQRGNNRQAVFFADSDYQAFLRWLKEGAEKYGCSIHAYVLMTNHIHLLATPKTRESISRMIQFVGRNYVTYIYHQYGRSGTLWEGRHKGCVIAAAAYMMACSRYIESNRCQPEWLKAQQTIVGQANEQMLMVKIPVSSNGISCIWLWVRQTRCEFLLIVSYFAMRLTRIRFTQYVQRHKQVHH